ncbi:hemerythrin domain-containing protein [Streptosporangium sp. NPDC000396]|uniref:hemerythrin domain-containing protein n=1 Tax=Streptosporangium sp. NPDC000396 TaxID=3366185 RepID=UPI0036B00E1D
MSEDALRPPKELSTLRERRVHLRRACHGLEIALAAPLTGRAGDWARQVAPAVARTREAFAAHISITEGPDGLFDEVRTAAPRLDGMLRQLHREHDDISARLAAAEEELRSPEEVDLERLRERLTTVLAVLSRHRQRGADLLYQAYEIDIGGE